MAQTHKTVSSRVESDFDAQCSALLNGGYTKNAGTVIGDETMCTFFASFINAGTDAPKITSAVEINFGDVVKDTPSAPSALAVSGINIVAPIVATSQSARVAVSGSPITDSSGTGIVSGSLSLVFTPNALGAFLSYMTITTTGGQTVNVILKGNGIA